MVGVKGAGDEREIIIRGNTGETFCQGKLFRME
jgi:hypothetical protein